MSDTLPADELNVKVALLTIIDNVNKTKALDYAIGYTRAAMHMTGYELYVQLLYILNSITHWRGPEATTVRNTLRQYVEDYKAAYYKREDVVKTAYLQNRRYV